MTTTDIAALKDRFYGLHAAAREARGRVQHLMSEDVVAHQTAHARRLESRAAGAAIEVDDATGENWPWWDDAEMRAYEARRGTA